jgi:hypothetical protein
MVIGEDHDTLRRLLGEKPDAAVMAEYDIWLRMFHRAGGSGGLGLQSLMALVRKLDRAPAKPAEKPADKDWREVPPGSRVEALYHGEWHPGVYQGRVENGILAIKLDDDEFVRECRPHMVRVTGAPQAAPAELEHDARYVPPSAEEAQDEVDLGEEEPAAVDWRQFKDKQPVHAIVDGKVQSGQFVGVNELEGGAYQVSVRVRNKEYLVPPQDVKLRD